jgi:hypothetical protein
MIELKIALNNLFRTKRRTSLSLFSRLLILNGRVRIRWKDLRRIYSTTSQNQSRAKLTFEYSRGRVLAFKTLEFISDEAVENAVRKLQYPADFDEASYTMIHEEAPFAASRLNSRAMLCFFLALCSSLMPCSAQLCLLPPSKSPNHLRSRNQFRPRFGKRVKPQDCPSLRLGISNRITTV